MLVLVTIISIGVLIVYSRRWKNEKTVDTFSGVAFVGSAVICSLVEIANV